MGVIDAPGSCGRTLARAQICLATANLHIFVIKSDAANVLHLPLAGNNFENMP